MELKIPEWGEDRFVFILLGRECYMVYDPLAGAWYRKVTRCNKCGKCCLGPFREDWPFGTQIIDGEEYCGGIKKAGDEWFCEASIAPFSCIRDLPNQLVEHPDCVIEYEKIE